MEKCTICEWNTEGMICPQYSFCGKLMKEHDKEVRNKVLDELVDKMKNRYFHKVGTQFDNAILEMEKVIKGLKK